MALVRAKVSTVVKDQVPEFIKDENANFTKFLQAYYEWFETEFVEENALENIRNIDDTVDMFIEYFERELLHPLPKAVIADKRLLLKHIKDIYSSKGNIKSYEFLFRVLFNEEPEIYFPKVDMLRVSDGKWDQRKLMRITEVTGDPNELVGQTVQQVIEYPDGTITTAEARFESIIQFAVGNKQIYQVVLSDDSIKGAPFLAENDDQTFSLTGLSNTGSGEKIVCNIESIISEIRVDEGGTYYSIGDAVEIISESGVEGRAEVSELGFGGISDIVITQTGSGYSVGDPIIFDHTDTGGPATAESARAIARVTEIDRDSILMEDGSYLLKEDLSQFDDETALTGGIKNITVFNKGGFYNKLPICSLPTADGRTGGKVLAISDDIARITKVIIPDNGAGYTNPPLAKPPLYMIVKNPTGGFSGGDIVELLPQTMMLEQQTQANDSNVEEFGFIFEDATVDGNGDAIGGLQIQTEKQQTATGIIEEIDLDLHSLKLRSVGAREAFVLESGEGELLDEDGDSFVSETSGFFANRNRIRTNQGTEATIISANYSDLEASVGPTADSIGGFINADGKVSESSKKIQDSFYYQDYSYVIKVGESINFYRDAVKKFLHPIGLALFGEVKIQTLIEGSTLKESIEVNGSGVMKRVVGALIDARIKAVGRYRTNEEDNQNLYKLHTILRIQDFVATALNMHVSESEFLPILKFPNITPEELMLLDMGIDEEDIKYKLIWENIVGAQAQIDPLRISSEAQLGLVVRPDLSGAARRPGFNLIDLERWKFAYRPYEAGDKEGHEAHVDFREDINLVLEDGSGRLVLEDNIVTEQGNVFIAENDLLLETGDRLLTETSDIFVADERVEFVVEEQGAIIQDGLVSEPSFTTTKYNDDPISRYPVPNFGYWNYANTQIKDFGHITVADIINNPYRRTNYAIESEIGIIRLSAAALRFSTDDFRFTWDDEFRMDSDSIGWGDDVYNLSNDNLTFDLYT